MTELVDAPAATGGGGGEGGIEAPPAFAVRLDNFEGPFDLLLSLRPAVNLPSPLI